MTSPYDSHLNSESTVVYSVSAESAVSVVIDDVATSQSGQALADLTGIERIEILRGPQSTLFGRNASAGVINVVTRGPSDQQESSVELTLTDDDQEKISASISGPITDDLGYRVTGYYDDIDGWVDNLFDGEQTDGSERWGVNTRLDWHLTDTFSLKLQGKYDDSDSSCCSPALTYVQNVEDAQVLTVIPLTRPHRKSCLSSTTTIPPSASTISLKCSPKTCSFQ